MESETLGSNGRDADNAVEVREGVKSPSPVNLSDENENDSENNEKPKKKSIIVWQCLNPECTNTNKTMLRYCHLYLPSLCLINPLNSGQLLVMPCLITEWKVIARRKER